MRAHLAANHPDPARASANLIIEKTTAADAFTLIGKHLARNDYRTQAEEVFGKALDTLAVARRQARENAQGIAEQTAATLKTMADNGFGTAAAQSLDTLPAGALRARVVAAIAKNEAEQGELANAAKLYAELGAGEAQSRAAAALAKAFADANQLDAAKRYAAAATATDDDRGRAWHGIARALAKNGDSAGALAALANISSPIWRIDALAQIAKAEAQRGDHDAAAQHFAQALALIPSLGDADARARALRTVLDAKSAAGDDAGARQIIEQIPDKTERSAALARQLAQQGQLPDALGVARAIADDSTRVQTLRWIAEGATLTNDVYGLLSREHPAGTTQSPTPPDAAATTAAVVGPRNPIKLSAQFDLRILDAAALGQRLPHPPQFEARASGVRARVPPIAPGNADEALMIYSQYNKKFFEDTEGESGGRNRLSKLQNDDNPRYIYLNSGVFNLDAIIHDLHGTGGETAVVRSGDVVTVRLPILISPTATLVISGNEVSEVRLSATSGGFIVNAGKLFVTDTRVVGFDEAKNAISRVFSKDSDAFRPFILSWSNSVTQLANSTFIALGYRSTKAFGVALSSGPTTITKDDPRSKRPTGVVVENSFENCYYGFYSYEADDVLVIGNEYRDNIIYGIDPHDRSHRLIIAYNTAYGTLVKHGIIISREVDYSAIIGNVTFANHGSGFMLDRDSVETLVYANTAFANRQDGLSIFESSCNIAASNHLFDNGRAGVKIRNSWDVALFQNRIVGNKGAGVEGYIVRLENSRAGATRDFELDPYTRLTTFTAVGNLIRANTAGIKALGVTGMTVVGNEFVHQTPLLFGGDLRPHTQALPSGSASQPSSGALITSTCQPPPPQRCSFRATGLFAGDGQEALFSSSANAPRCDEIPGTVQHQALVRTNGISAANESNEE
ncbi:MAG: NosD domain-containing protein [Gammaproteobacteria bacterium]